MQEELEDTKEVIRICKLKKNRQHNGQKLEDTKEVIRICKLKKNIQHNDQKRRTYNTMAKREGHTTQ